MGGKQSGKAVAAPATVTRQVPYNSTAQRHIDYRAMEERPLPSDKQRMTLQRVPGSAPIEPLALTRNGSDPLEVEAMITTCVMPRPQAFSSRIFQDVVDTL